MLCAFMELEGNILRMFYALLEVNSTCQAELFLPIN